MSGATLPYRLRPHKAVDRRLFLELLNRYERWRSLEDHAYVSMAAFAMEDQRLVHRLLGIERLVAFDMDKDVVGRQLFNRPTSGTKCVSSTATSMVKDIELSVQAAGILDAEGYIVWLDYTDPKQIGTQVADFHKLLTQLGTNDIVRVTVNANYDWWAGKSYPSNPVPIDVRQARAFNKLTKELKTYLPTTIKADDLGEEGIAVALAQTFGRAAGAAIKGRRIFEPLSIVRYADGQQMLTITGTVVELAERAALRAKLGLGTWPFASTNWSDVKYLAVPDLTARERLYLERNAHVGAAGLSAALQFDFEAAAEMPGFIDNFRRYYRHYPAFTAVEL